MSTETDGIAESSPAEPTAPIATTAAERAVASDDVAGFRAAKAAERAGKPLTVAAEIDTAKPVDQAASTEVTDPASEAGKPRGNAESRIKELLEKARKADERAAAAERRAADLEASRTQPKDEPKAAPSPAAAPEKFPSYDDYLTEHPESSYEDYLDARADFRAEAKFKSLEAAKAEASERETVTRTVRERDEQYVKVMREAIAAEPDFLDKCSEAVQSLRPFEALTREADGRWRNPQTGQYVLPGHAALAGEILSSPVAPQLMRHFSDHPEDMERLARLTPREFFKEFGGLEKSLHAGKAERGPAPKTVTDAPRPPTQLGRQATQSADPEMAAVAAGDQAALKALRLQRRAANFR